MLSYTTVYPVTLTCTPLQGGCKGGTRRSNGGTPKRCFHGYQDHSVILISVPVMLMTRYEVRGRLVATAQQLI